MPVQTHDRGAAGSRTSGEHVQQSRLADTGRTADVQHQRAIVTQQRVEQRQLTLAADEAAPRAVGQQVTDRGLRRHFQLTSSSLQYCVLAAGTRGLSMLVPPLASIFRPTTPVWFGDEPADVVDLSSVLNRVVDEGEEHPPGWQLRVRDRRLFDRRAVERAANCGFVT